MTTTGKGEMLSVIIGVPLKAPTSCEYSYRVMPRASTPTARLKTYESGTASLIESKENIEPVWEMDTDLEPSEVQERLVGETDPDPSTPIAVSSLPVILAYSLPNPNMSKMGILTDPIGIVKSKVYVFPRNVIDIDANSGYTSIFISPEPPAKIVGTSVWTEAAKSNRTEKTTKLISPVVKATE